MTKSICALPLDPGTKKWLVNNGDSVFGFPDLVRFSWSTVDTLFVQNAHPFKWYATPQTRSAGRSIIALIGHPASILGVKGCEGV